MKTPKRSIISEYVGEIHFYIWDSNVTGERKRVDLSKFTFTCGACKKRIPYETKKMYASKGEYICFNKRCQMAFILQNI
jgi:hypothetical protein